MSSAAVAASRDPPGLTVRQTPASREALRSASSSDSVGTPSLRRDASAHVDADAVPFRLLRDVAAALRATDPTGTGPRLQDLTRGGGLALESPTRAPRDPALEARCRALRENLQAAAYDRMTRDVRHASAAHGPRVSALTRDLGFGAHVLTAMVACFAVGVAAGRSFAPDDIVAQAALGAAGMFCAMIAEAVLFILRDAKT